MKTVDEKKFIDWFVSLPPERQDAIEALVKLFVKQEATKK